MDSGISRESRHVLLFYVRREPSEAISNPGFNALDYVSPQYIANGLFKVIEELEYVLHRL